VGRVQTPTLSIVVEREEKIRKHVPRDYWELRATSTPRPAVRRQVVRPEVEEEPRRPGGARRPPVERGRREAIARPAAASRPPSPRRPSPAPEQPGLYDLTTLQREANSRFGFSAKTTLSIAQALYEKHKVLTYPRTDSAPLPEDYVAW
jgi:DNA topoisomerase-3